jgi:TetR/AcrR family transcriptional repressor of nem operon
MRVMARPRKFDEAQVVRAAANLFWRNGYQATSTRDLSEHTGLGPSSLYQFFGDKHGLYLRALRDYYETSMARQAVILSGPGSALARLRELLMMVVELDVSPAGRPGCFAINAAIELAPTDPEVEEQVRKHFAATETAIRDVIAAGQISGEIDPTREADAVARHVLAVYYGLRVLGRAIKDREALVSIVDELIAATVPDRGCASDR